jgi:hypothetical protein
VLPMIELAKTSSIPTPLLNSIFQIYQSLTNYDFKSTGRTLKNLGLENKTVSEILEML